MSGGNSLSTIWRNCNLLSHILNNELFSLTLTWKNPSALMLFSHPFSSIILFFQYFYNKNYFSPGIVSHRNMIYFCIWSQHNHIKQIIVSAQFCILSSNHMSLEPLKYLSTVLLNWSCNAKNIKAGLRIPQNNS